MGYSTEVYGKDEQSLDAYPYSGIGEFQGLMAGLPTNQTF